MTKDAFISKYQDELCGLLLGAFGQIDRNSHKAAIDTWAADGQFMIAQLKRARDILGRMWDDASAINGPVDLLVDELIKRMAGEPHDSKARIAEKIRPSFQAKQEQKAGSK